MSVRHSLIALLGERAMHAYQLKLEFERRTGGTWPLNIGQVSTTLQRLVRDGLVMEDPMAEEGRPERYVLTGAGRAELAAWWATPVERGTPAREELTIKLAMAVTTPGVDVTGVVRAQRTETMRALHDYTRLAGLSAVDDLAWSLVLDSLTFAAEAEIRWLDHVEARVRRASAGVRAVDAPTTTADDGAVTRPASSIRGGVR
ncbi:MAG: PadR family transcriptional regulator [Veillonellaceae bacterium]|nr:PadR family transcriptional regulator [Veillonellaceae bacterium]